MKQKLSTLNEQVHLPQRRWIFSSNSYAGNVLHRTNPWIVVWWSMAFPGFGHLIINHYFWGFLLIAFEYLVNNLGHVNEAIYYSMIGEITKSKSILHVNWTFLYVLVYAFSMWDCYRRSIENNKVYELANKEKGYISTFQFSPLEINILEKKEPILACIWSSFGPGLGEFYLHKLPYFLVSLSWWLVVIFCSNIYEGVFHSMVGEISVTKDIVPPQWILFIPSIYCFSMYYSYTLAIENNKLFEKEKAMFLVQRYQEGDLNELYK
ncbi:hypothetical protein NC797_06365 [Aquibacillus sp. 3ASR75-11]|uniref:Uncharacterized protein n=1 Tax=Terrihalobacillus insolitus TaxID=2950438 RepID=A0A9X3WTU7_9BACI|nr:hypothetical protein [Terrihalobacillus insolitus]MDC3414041.1 hypothetical protein [Terrihalobacillus insolitus]MDC3424131.1 hypothetical protein [Terrihalobacillus insolitus]